MDIPTIVTGMHPGGAGVGGGGAGMKRSSSSGSVRPCGGSLDDNASHTQLAQLAQQAKQARQAKHQAKSTSGAAESAEAGAPTCIVISPSTGSLSGCTDTVSRPRKTSSGISRGFLQIPGSANLDMEDLLYELDGKLSRLRQLQQEVKAFQVSCHEARTIVQATAKELVAKIMDHQNRLMDEIDTRQDTEIRKLGYSYDTVEEYVDKISELQEQGYKALQNDDTDTLLSIQEKAENPDMFWSDNLNKFLLEGGGSSEEAEAEGDEDEVSLPKLTFVPIRCNTAFGTVEDMRLSDTASQAGSISHDRSSSVMTNLSIPSSPVLSRNRAQSARESPSHKLSLALQKSLSLEMHSPHTFRRSKSVREKCTTQNSSVLLERIHDSLKRSNSMRESRVKGGASFVPITLWEVTDQGSKPGQLGCPCSIAFMPSKDIIIAEKDNERLQVFNSRGKFVRVIGQGRVKPQRLCVTHTGNIAVTDAKDNVIKIFDITGHCKGSFGKRRFKSLFKTPYAIAENQNGDYIVSDMERHTVGIYNAENAKCIRVLEPGRNYQFKAPFYIATDHRDRIIVSDNGGATIQVFDSQGKYILSFDRYSDNANEQDMLKYPNGVGVDDRNNILVADWGNHSVSMFSPSGHFIKHVVTRAQALYHPADIAVKPNECQLLISEYSEDHSALRLYKVAL